jgi:hypothetical protein
LPREHGGKADKFTTALLILKTFSSVYQKVTGAALQPYGVDSRLMNILRDMSENAAVK